MKRYFILLCVIIICIYALYLRLPRLSLQEFTPDEHFQISQMKGSVTDLLRSLPEMEFCSYLSGDHYIVYPFFKIFSYNRYALAFPHVVATILGFYLLYLVCRLYFKTLLGYIIVFIVVCFNENLIYHTTEIRPYAVLPTLALGSFYFSQLLIEQPYISRIKKLLIGAFFVSVIWFHFYGIMILFLSFIYSWLTKLHTNDFKDALKRNLKFLAIVLCIAMPLWLFSVFGKHLKYRTDVADMIFAHICNPLVNPIGFLKAIFGNLVGYKKFYFLLIGIFFPFVIPLKERYKQIGFLLMLVFLPIMLILFMNLITQYYFVQRHFIWTMPFFAFYLGWVWESAFIYIKEKFISA